MVKRSITKIVPEERVKAKRWVSGKAQEEKKDAQGRLGSDEEKAVRRRRNGEDNAERKSGLV